MSAVRAVRRASGFTLVELVAVIVVLGIVAALAAPRFFAVGGFARRGFAEEVRAALAFAHKLAVAGGCDTRVQVAPGGVTIGHWSSCRPADHAGATAPVTRPDGGPLVLVPPAGVSVGTLDLYFDRIGRPRAVAPGPLPPLVSDPAALRVTVGDTTLQIEPETGLVRVP